jgi:hypothetical protein
VILGFLSHICFSAQLMLLEKGRRLLIASGKVRHFLGPACRVAVESIPSVRFKLLCDIRGRLSRQTETLVEQICNYSICGIPCVGFCFIAVSQYAPEWPVMATAEIQHFVPLLVLCISLKTAQMSRLLIIQEIFPKLILIFVVALIISSCAEGNEIYC